MGEAEEKTVPCEEGTSYEKWAESEGIPIIKTFFVEDIREVKLKWWERKGGYGAFLHMEGAGQVNNCYLCEIPAGKSLKPQKHLFEETIYVVSGQGATTVWNHNQEEGKQTFEWQTGSLFSPPLNSWHQHFNGSGSEPARYLAVTTAPTMLNLLHNLDFIFKNEFPFQDRFDGRDGYFTGQGLLYTGDYKGFKFAGNVWDTNFVPDVRGFKLMDYSERGAGGSNIKFELSENTTACHISEFPVGTYKKAHRHSAGAHVIILSGQGYSLIWPEGAGIKKYGWQAGSMVVPPENWWHQHFNTGDRPARYLALRAFGSKKYRGVGKQYKGTVDRKKGGDQIEYADEDPIVRQLFEEALGKRGIQSQMQRHYEKR
ncbi:MAG: cupin domain-containing protein [Deltaproteobacteria bacterium]|nr:cupin domain-containing protein [Deltaproteobacteria bacterium]